MRDPGSGVDFPAARADDLGVSEHPVNEADRARAEIAAATRELTRRRAVVPDHIRRVLDDTGAPSGRGRGRWVLTGALVTAGAGWLAWHLGLLPPLL